MPALPRASAAVLMKDLPNFRDPETGIVHAPHRNSRLEQGFMVTICEFDDRNQEFVESMPEKMLMTRAVVTCLRCICGQ